MAKNIAELENEVTTLTKTFDKLRLSFDEAKNITSQQIVDFDKELKSLTIELGKINATFGSHLATPDIEYHVNQIEGYLGKILRGTNYSADAKDHLEKIDDILTKIDEIKKELKNLGSDIDDMESDLKDHAKEQGLSREASVERDLVRKALRAIPQ